MAQGISDEQQKDRRELLQQARHARPGHERQSLVEDLRPGGGTGLRPDPRRRGQGVRPVAGEERAAGQLRPHHVRAGLPGGAAAGRTRRPLRHHQLRRLGHAQAALSRPCAASCRRWTEAWRPCFRTWPDRGLLDSTIVWWSGEFGRTPKVAWEAPWNGGRIHFGKVFSRRGGRRRIQRRPRGRGLRCRRASR